MWLRSADIINLCHRVNVLGSYLVTSAFLPLLRKGKKKVVGPMIPSPRAY